MGPRPAREKPSGPLVLAVIGLTLMGFNSIRVGFLPISDIVFFGLAALLWLLMLTGRVSRLSPPSLRGSSARLLVATIVLLALATVSSFRSWYPAESMSVVLRLGYLTILWFWIMRCISADRRAIALLMRGWRWGVLISCGAAIVANAGLVTIGRTNPENRQAGWFYHPNDLAGYIAVAIPLFVFAAPRAVTSKSRLAGVWWLATVGVSVFALSTTGSLSATLGAAAGIAASSAAFLLTRRQVAGKLHPLKAMALATIAAIGLTVLFNSDVPVAERLTRYEEGDSEIAGSVGARGTLNERVINQFDELLLVGNGLDIRAQDDLRGTDSGIHNMYIKTLYEGGLIAALALVVMLIVVLQQAWKLLISMRDTDVHLDIVAVFGSAVAGMVFALFQPMTVQRYFWMPFAVIQCFWVVRRAELRAQTRAAAGNGGVGSPMTSRSSVTRLER